MRRWSGNWTTTASPESAHSLSVPRGSASSRLSGIVLMAMKFLPFHNEFVTDFATDNEKNHLRPLNIIQRAEIAGAEFELNQWIWSQSLDGPRWLCWLLRKPG